MTYDIMSSLKTSDNWRDRLRDNPEEFIVNKLFSLFTFLSAIFIIIVVIASVLILYINALPLLENFGWGVVFESQWFVPREEYGMLVFIFGTLITSIFALFLSIPLSIGSAIFINEYAPKQSRSLLSFILELIAALPSVLIGLWGIFILTPLLRETIIPTLLILQPFKPLFYGIVLLIFGYWIFTIALSFIRTKTELREKLLNITFLLAFMIIILFGISLIRDPTTLGTIFNVFTSIIALTIMITPIIASITREILAAVPDSQREAAYALGATKWEVNSIAVLPLAKRGIYGAAILGYGRAIGETMAVTMLIGNSNNFFQSIFDNGSTITSIIANEWGEAIANPNELGALLLMGLILFIISIFINAIARIIIGKSATSTARMEG